MRGLVCWLIGLSLGCAEIAELRDDPTLIEEGDDGGPQGCVDADPGSPGFCPYGGCESDGDCAGPTLCDRDWKTCKPICTSGTDCSSGECLPATDGGVQLEGLSLCAAMCDPVDATICGQGAACFQRGTAISPNWDCGVSLGWIIGQLGCEAQGDRPCANGLACVDDRCQKYCFVDESKPMQCSTTGCVALLDSNEVFEGKPLGSCY